MRIIAAGLSLAVAAACLAQNQGSGRWWTVPAGKLLEDRLKAHKKRNPEQAEQAEQLAARYEAKITEYRNKIQVDLKRLDDEREDLRKKGYSGAGRQAWQTWFEKDRELYKPIEQLIGDFGKELTAFAAVAGGAPPVTVVPTTGGTAVPPVGGVSTPATGMPTTPVNPYAIPRTGGPAPPTGGSAGLRGPWASAEQVEAMLGNLPAEPNPARLKEVFDMIMARGKIPADDKEQAAKLLAKAQEEFKTERERLADQIGKVQRAIRVVRQTPSSIRAADLRLIRDHWLSLHEDLNDVIQDLQNELTDLEE